MHDVFVSYATPDKQVADAIVHHLESIRIRCFIAPRNILPGLEWRGQLEKGIKQSKVFVLILSGHSNISEPCRKEIFTAAEAGLNILQFKLQKVELHPDLAFELRGRHWLDAVDPPLITRIQELSSALIAILKHDPNPLPSATPASPPLVEENQEHQPSNVLSSPTTDRLREDAGASSIKAALPHDSVFQAPLPPTEPAKNRGATSQGTSDMGEIYRFVVRSPVGSFICFSFGILSWVVCRLMGFSLGFMIAGIAIFFGHQALREIKQSSVPRNGKLITIIGLILGYYFILCAFFLSRFP